MICLYFPSLCFFHWQSQALMQHPHHSTSKSGYPQLLKQAHSLSLFLHTCIVCFKQKNRPSLALGQHLQAENAYNKLGLSFNVINLSEAATNPLNFRIRLFKSSIIYLFPVVSAGLFCLFFITRVQIPNEGLSIDCIFPCHAATLLPSKGRRR